MQRLTDRELEVFQWFGHGSSVKQIADRLNISVKTVQAHRANIKTKLRLAHANELTIKAIRWVESHEGSDVG